jgi:hypothetical protein
LEHFPKADNPLKGQEEGDAANAAPTIEDYDLTKEQVNNSM